jgi:hypothetical protein
VKAGRQELYKIKPKIETFVEVWENKKVTQKHLKFFGNIFRHDLQYKIMKIYSFNKCIHIGKPECRLYIILNLLMNFLQ